jgi:hypothetical protein
MQLRAQTAEIALARPTCGVCKVHILKRRPQHIHNLLICWSLRPCHDVLSSSSAKALRTRPAEVSCQTTAPPNMTGFWYARRISYDEMPPPAVSLDHLVLMISVTSGWTTAAYLTIDATSKIGVCQRTLLMLETVRMCCAN